MQFKFGVFLYLLFCLNVRMSFEKIVYCDDLNLHRNINASSVTAVNSVPIDKPFSVVKFTAQIILEILRTQKITSLSIISDRMADPTVNVLLLQLNDPRISVMMYTVDQGNVDSVMESYVSLMQQRTDDTLTMVLCADPQNTLRTFKSLGKFLDITKQTGIEHHLRWLTLSPNKHLNELEREIARLDNVVIVAPIIWNFQPIKCPTLGVYTKHIKQFHRYLDEIGFTSEDCRLFLNGTLYPNVGGGFNWRHFTIGLYVWDPFTLRINESNSLTYEGFCVDLVKELSVRLNFRYTFTEPADNKWGSPLPNGNWTGVVGMLQRHEIDISVAAMIITEERETVMDGTFPFYYDHVGVLYKRLDPEDSMWKTYFHPFKTEVFTCLGAAVILCCIIYLFLSLLSPSKSKIVCHRKVSCLEGLSHAASEVDNIVSAVFQQGRPDLPTHCSGQVFLAFWWIFLMIVAAIYKGNLIAFLMVPQEEIPFETLYELASQDRYKWGVTGSTVVEYLFQISQRPDFKMLGEGIEDFKASDKTINSLDPLVHLAKVKKGYYAYISDMVPMEIWMSKECDLRLLKQTVIPLPFVMGLQNNSGFLNVFNKHLLDIDQMGLYSVWKQRWWPQMGACGQDGRTAGKVLSVVETQSSFYVLCIGLLLSILCLLIEYLLKTKLFMRMASSAYIYFLKIKNIFMTCRR